MNENYENNENFDYMLPQGIPQEESVQNVDDGQQSTQTFFDMHPFQEYKTIDEAQELAERQLRNNVRKLTEEGWLPVSQQKDENLLFNGTNADGTLMFYNPNIHSAIDPETGRRTVQLINPVTMEKQIGYTIDELPELVVNGLMGGIERNVDGSPKIDKETNSVIDTYLRDWYKENKDYVDQLSDQDREELFRYLNADHYEDQMKNTKMMFDGQEIHPNYSIIKSSTPTPPKVYTDYVNHVIDEAYKSTDQLAWLGGPFSTAYYAPRALQDLLRERYAGALENGTMAILPWAGRGAGLGKQVASFAAAGLPLSAYYAYEGSPEEALITLGSFAAMPVLGKAVHEMNVPAASAAVADMLKEAADKGAIGYYSALAQLTRAFKNSTGDMKVLFDKSLKQIEEGLTRVKDESKILAENAKRNAVDVLYPSMEVITPNGQRIRVTESQARELLGIESQFTQNMGKFTDGIKEKANRAKRAWDVLTGKQETNISTTGTPSVETPRAETPVEEANINSEKTVNQGTGEPIADNNGTQSISEQPEETKKLNLAEKIKELGNASFTNKNGDVENLATVDFNEVIRGRGDGARGFVTVDGKKISLDKYLSDELLPSHLEESFDRLKSMVEQKINVTKRSKWESVPFSKEGTELTKYPDYNSIREASTDAVKATNGKVKRNTVRLIENEEKELLNSIKVNCSDSGVSINKEHSAWKKLTDKQKETLEDLRGKLEELYKKGKEDGGVGFDLSSLEGGNYSFYDLMYPQFGKCKPLKQAVKKLNLGKFQEEYQKKLGNDPWYKQWGTLEDFVYALSGGIGGYTLSPSENSSITDPDNLGFEIIGATAIPLIARGLRRRGFIGRSSLGNQLNQKFSYYQSKPEQFQFADKIPTALKAAGAAGLGFAAAGQVNRYRNNNVNPWESSIFPWSSPDNNHDEATDLSTFTIDLGGDGTEETK